ncbi:uncharacterized protein LOC113879725 isoform X4 [Bos indicus x Bos taurus]|uniref:uncharacterized protein LOC113879725 isoform X4 n=1 Tax=Bos indicus x Bos taurus TaxID=30522 RepID=UPI000F7D0C6E|nr:uncharacterized protein LOC113879725 isoform X4 [Bos indicus x Bos taurus]
MARRGAEFWSPPFLASGSSALLSRPGEPCRPNRGAQRFAASRPAALGTRGAGHCPAPASAMISAKPLPAPPPPPQAAAAMFSFLIPGPATAAGRCAPLVCFKCPKLTGARSRCNFYHCAEDSESPQAHERFWLLGVPIPPPPPPPPPLPSSSPSQSRRHLGSPLNSGARGATQAAAAGAARWPHHLKRQERSCESRSGGGLGWRWEAGPGLPRWRERRERRRRNAGRAGDEPGLPRAPRTHRRASAGRVCVRRALCSSSAPLRIRKGVDPASGCCGLRGFLPAGCSGSGVLEPAVVFTGGSRSRRRSRRASGGLGLGSSRARPPPRVSCPSRLWGWTGHPARRGQQSVGDTQQKLALKRTCRLQLATAHSDFLLTPE